MSWQAYLIPLLSPALFLFYCYEQITWYCFIYHPIVENNCHQSLEKPIDAECHDLFVPFVASLPTKISAQLCVESLARNTISSWHSNRTWFGLSPSPISYVLYIYSVLLMFLNIFMGCVPIIRTINLHSFPSWCAYWQNKYHCMMSVYVLIAMQFVFHFGYT